ncbi:L,D-transpeptidase family protein [Myxococcus landrumensis]|uniref:L,D-transpeptidase family protein n=1 Tax=Myxococcus landrumensis TaxID=2813577 RepID=A0ABX7NFG7_9BACT|nr:L,D-transpeptidase family protein [Myxococcus landrumus]QSQ16330.1 L,D-transpeptidase family protein [Myxococcus landrumus]
MTSSPSCPRWVLPLCLLVFAGVARGASEEVDPFESFLRPAHPAAEGFSPWPDLSKARAGSPVSALARGRVVSVGPERDRVTLEHLVHENHELVRVRTEYSGLEAVELRADALVTRGQVLGRVGKTSRPSVSLVSDRRLSIEEARRFTSSRARLPQPAAEPVLVLISHAKHQLRLYERGIERARVEVGFGQETGPKEERGDNRTPVGMYFIVHTHRGEFPGPYGAYYGGHWLKVNYPNPWDALRGVERGWLTEKTRERIARTWEAREATEASTRLGSGIGFHGWKGEWSLEQTQGRLSWGCVVFHPRDIATLYERMPRGTMVVLF